MPITKLTPPAARPSSLLWKKTISGVESDLDFCRIVRLRDAFPVFLFPLTLCILPNCSFVRSVEHFGGAIATKPTKANHERR